MANRWTTADLCELTGYTRDQVRGLVDSLPPKGLKDGRRRAATVYSLPDLVFVALCCRLERHYGLRRDMVAALSPHIGELLDKPRKVGLDRMLLTFDPPRAQAVEEGVVILDGLVVGLDPVFEQVDDYLLPSGSARAALGR